MSILSLVSHSFLQPTSINPVQAGQVLQNRLARLTLSPKPTTNCFTLAPRYEASLRIRT